MNKARKAVEKAFKLAFKPADKSTPSEWVQKHIRLSTKTSANKAGRYSLSHTPYLKQIYDDIANTRVRKIVLKKSAQIGATQFANNVILYYVCNQVFPVLMIMPKKETAQQFCERSLTPTILSCDAVKPYLSGNPDDLKKTDYLFNSCIVRVIGGGSVASLASNPACLCIIDESDKGTDYANQGEAPALELAEDRTISFPNDKKIIVMSTPTTETTSVVHSQYLLGSQSKYYVACPHCKGEQVLHFDRDRIKWPDDCKNEQGEYDLDRIEREAYYDCEHCHAHLTETDKIGMVRGGRWKDTNPKPFPAEVRSYHISALYSFNITWGGMAKLFLLSKDDNGKLRNFYNSYLGECFEERAATIRKDDIDELVKISPDYKRGTLPGKPLAVIMAADTQGDCFWYGIEAVYPGGVSAVIDWGQAATFQDLEEVSLRRYPIAGTGEEVGIYKALIDSGGNRTSQVYDFSLKSRYRFIPVVGRTSKQGLFDAYRETTVAHKQYNVPLLILDDKRYKDILYISVIKDKLHTLHFPQDVDDELKIQLTSERLVNKPDNRNRLVAMWVSSNRRNHLGDCFKYIEGYKEYEYPRLKAAEEKARVIVEPQVDKAATETNAVREAPKRQYQLRSSVWGRADSWD